MNNDKEILEFKYYDLNGNEIASNCLKKIDGKTVHIFITDFGGDKPTPLIYNVQEVVKAIEQNKNIYVVNTEKQVEEYRKKGLVATTFLGGLNNVDSLPREIKNILRRAKLCYVTDKDTSKKLNRIISNNYYSNEYIGNIYEQKNSITIDNKKEKGDIKMEKELERTNKKFELSCEKQQENNILQEQLDESGFIVQDLRGNIKCLEAFKNEKKDLKLNKVIDKVIKRYNYIIEEELMKIIEAYDIYKD